jgi:hypothetical protein
MTKTSKSHDLSAKNHDFSGKIDENGGFLMFFVPAGWGFGMS